MKPRLKLSIRGTVQVLMPGVLGWHEWEARRFIRSHYGSLQAFAIRFNLPYSAVCSAVKAARFEKTAGPIALVRQLIGLKSNPSKHSTNLSLAHKLRQAKLGASK